ncbi:MAG: protein-L-isoaspartate(D-aspartate) O-methyltransferase [Elusimicrobia bacterium CG_4_9_14_3_um_filter_62_55]|nr:MAG: protein-L-isoaspartate O-methyltransferase [Elusimicrobia bacterium CG22_combo_CG10-13_8_21_14_all_63_91]PJA12957.1 MAG: protein-L-isoaspartate(D-aspartate) O-methyltransferase [Elusimicrobia bacterium CG_4_10_14_0_2_um_filter_63_34]PJB25794.1 MAG: protein-L-isoaspartate(D-aspartate) O-methyltransferase [Elusimicrobia bacterium CG_4_9_14_3_um_filter_62_55]
MRGVLILLLAAGGVLHAQGVDEEGGEAPVREIWARKARKSMVQKLLRYKKNRIVDRAVIAAMEKVERHRFVPEAVARFAYEDRPLPIGEGQTISQPFIVAFMTQLLAPRAGEKVLEIGTGSGYQAAILAELGAEVYSIEIIDTLARRAERTLDALGYDRVRVRLGDGYKGWPRAAPFDAVIVTCAPDHVPEPLIQQLKVGGRMVIPVGAKTGSNEWAVQELVVIRKTAAGLERERTMDVRFVPMTGEAENRKVGQEGITPDPSWATSDW